MFWRRMNYAGAVAGLIGGFFFTVVVIVSLALLHIQLHWIYVGFLVQVLIVILVVIVSLCFPPPARPQWEPFRWTPRLLWTAEGEKRPWYKSLILWYGVYAAIWIYIYWRFW
ncbi:MAG: hypothetical protein BWY71_02117 [Planctomycetes bacterium ADurb.Bin412]|nr:MAG: hypothetical protein BWY71_02117 [Planctomycetes bacterium ADurb.Bin412]